MNEDKQDNQALEANQNLQRGLRILAKIIAREILVGRFPDCPADVIKEQAQEGSEKDERQS